MPVTIKDIGSVVIGHAPRLGEFGFQNNDDAVESVIMMRRGEQTQTVLKAVEAKTKDLNQNILPPDVKVHPYYDRSDLIQLTTHTVEHNLFHGMILVFLVLIFFLVSVRAAVIAALTIPLALLFAFIVLHLHNGAANLLSLGAIDFGIVIDGTVVMVENIYRELALREGQSYKLHEVILLAAKDVDRPIFYSVAIILTGYLPIYALSGPSGKLFHPTAETMVPGFTDLTVVRELGQPSLLIDVDRDKIARYGINVSDVEAAISTAVGGQAVTQVIQGEKLFDLVVRMQPQFRSSATAIGNLLVGAPDGEQIPLSQLANIHQGNGASFIYRENNSRYIGVQYSVQGRDLASAVEAGQKTVNQVVHLPQGYRMTWGGEYSQFLAAKAQLEIILPLAVICIFMILFALYGNFKFPAAIALGVIMTEPVSALIALKLSDTPFSVSSVLGLLALMGVSVEVVVILVSFINKLRLEGMDIRTATREAALMRLRPIMITAMVACLGLLPAALSTGIGSDSKKPFAIVIVAGLVWPLLLGFFVNPALYLLVAREGDVLQV